MRSFKRFVQYKNAIMTMINLYCTIISVAETGTKSRFCFISNERDLRTDL